jgi:hypothetical protein
VLPDTSDAFRPGADVEPRATAMAASERGAVNRSIRPGRQMPGPVVRAPIINKTYCSERQVEADLCRMTTPTRRAENGVIQVTHNGPMTLVGFGHLRDHLYAYICAAALCDDVGRIHKDYYMSACDVDDQYSMNS